MFKTTILGHPTPSLLTCVKAVPIAQKIQFHLLTHLHPHTYAHHTIWVPTLIFKSSLKSQLQCTFFRNTLLHPNYIRAIYYSYRSPYLCWITHLYTKFPCSIRVSSHWAVSSVTGRLPYSPLHPWAQPGAWHKHSTNMY